MELNDLIDHELEQREKLKHLVMEKVFSLCSIGVGAIKRGILQQYLYNQLGFHGRKSNPFCRWSNKVFTSEGFRCGYLNGERVVYGLIPNKDLDFDTKLSILPKYYKS